MTDRLRILIAEDAENDAELAVRELKRAGLSVDARRVQTAAEYRRLLEEFQPHVILSDFSMPQFDGMEALRMARQSYPDIPFIFVSGTLGEEYAVRALKNGATDYVVKTNLIRLPVAVERALQETRERHARQALEEELRSSEKRYRQLFESNPHPMWVYDTETLRFLAVNDTAVARYGFSREEFLAMAIEDIHPEEELPRLRQFVARSVSGLSESGTWRHRTRNGRLIDLEITSHDLLFEGRPARMVVAHDVTERRRAEAQLKESEERFRQLAENIREVFWMNSVDTGESIYISPAYEQIWGRPLVDLRTAHREWTEAVHPEDRERLLEHSQKVVAGKGLLDFVYRIVRPDGSVRWIHDRGFPVRDAEGRVYRVAGIAEDITERRRAEEALLESETRLRAIIETEPACVKTVSAQGELLVMNQAGLAMLQASSLAAAKQQPLIDFITPEHRVAFADLHERVMNGESGTLEFEVVGLKGGRRWLETHAVPLRDSTGKVQHLLGITHDITIRRNQEQKIARLTRIYAVLSGINAAIVRIRDRQELFREACRIIVEQGGFTVGWIAMLAGARGGLVPVAHAGLPIDFAAGGESSAGLTPASAAETALREKRAVVDNDIGRDPDTEDLEVGADTKSVRRAAIRLGAKSVIVLPLFLGRETFGVLTLYAPEQGFFDDEEIKLLKELAGDISFALEFIAKEEKVDYLAYYDPLTGLPNRTLFFDRLARQLGSAARERQNVALLLLDLDRFRMINDTLGRQAGDALLSAVAQRIGNVTRDQDTVARLGADSFAVAVSGNWKIADLAQVLDARNEAVFGRPFLAGQEELRVSATAGIVMFPGDGENPESLFANAEAALRKAKEQSARFLFYSPEMNARVAESLRLENRLRRALENGEMVLWYQPKVSVKTRRVTGLEALIRWNDPETGMVGPAKFIPLMEQTGLILDAGRWAMSQVARDCLQWTTKSLKPPPVAVNVSPIQLHQTDFVDVVLEAVEKMREAGAALDLEITESVFMENLEDTIRKLQIVRGLGVNIAVDDFGTGYSSLAYIARLPIHALKIDRSFVVGMTGNEESLVIVKSIISLAHSLKLQVVAEGVETEGQAAQLEELGCDQLQGYLFNPPVPAKDVSRLLG